MADRSPLHITSLTRPIDPLAGGGEMGALMRSIDWSRTAVGAPATWPQSLRTALNILLETGFPMYIAWGPEFVQFYNDGYRPILGSTKHPAAMGLSTRETFAEIWDIIGPMFHGVMEGTATTVVDFLLPLERHGFVEECYFIFSYSPIREESGNVGGVLVTVTETTERVLGARRLKTLQELSSKTQEAPTAEAVCEIAAGVLAENPSDLPFALLYLLEPDGRGATLAGAAGIEPGVPTGPARIDLTSEDRPWPARQVLTLPIAQPGQERPIGLLVAAISPRLVLDEKYRSFLELTAGQIATAISRANALAEAKARAEALAEIDRAKTAFFSNVSHELRTPLTLILGPARDALSRADTLPAGDVESWEFVHRNGLRLLKLVNTLLDFSRIEAGRVQASYEPTDLAPLTRDLASVFHSAIENAGLRLALAIEDLGEPVFVDHDMWEKIVLNLVSNALKFTFEGEIEVALRRSGDQAVLTVRDTGIGVSADQLPLLFDRFHRVPGARSRTHEGTGIGLSLVQELVKLHGGTITVSSVVDQGTEITVALPFGSAHLPQDRIEARRSLSSTAVGTEVFVQEALRWSPDAPKPMPEAPPKVAGAARILLADDNADMRDYVARLLRERWDVETAADGSAALERIREAPPDLVLADIMMPGMDGFELLQAVRADPRTRAIPVIFLSARAGEESRIEGLSAGADDYLIKPFSARELLARVGTHLKMVQTRREIEAARNLLEAVMDRIPAGVMVVEAPSGRTLLANARVQEILGQSARPTRSIDDFASYPAVHADGRPFAVREYSLPRALAGEVVMNQEVLYRHPDGTERVISASAAPVYDSKGTIIAAVNAFSDVTDRKRAEEQRQQSLVREREARAEAEVANRSKDEFLAMLGHELRNPLAPIVTALHLMHLRGDDTLHKERTIIERQVNHLVRLVDDLLDVSRITRGRIELKRERIELSEILAKAIEMASPLIEQRQHQLAIDVRRQGLALDADSVRLAQVVANLLNNAAKYTEPHGTISVSALREGDEIVLRVRDTGIGLSPEMLPRVFDLFVQERQAIDRAQGGLGLGLAIVRTLVELHGGRVEARSEGQGRGSELTVRLPAACSDEAEAPKTTLREDEAAPLSGSLRILVVDDNVDTAELLAESVRMMGHATQVAHDGPTALRIATQFRPDAALLDIGLPVMDGYELAAHLRALPDLAAVRLIAVTGYDQEADRRHTQAAGFERHLVKPIDLEELRGILAGAGEHGHTDEHGPARTNTDSRTSRS